MPGGSNAHLGTGSGGLSVGARVGIAVGIVAAVIASVTCFFVLGQEWRRRVRRPGWQGPGWQEPGWTQPDPIVDRPSSHSTSHDLHEFLGEGLSEAPGRDTQELEVIRPPRELAAVGDPKELPVLERPQEIQSALQQRESPVHDRHGSAATGSARYMQ